MNGLSGDVEDVGELMKDEGLGSKGTGSAGNESGCPKLDDATSMQPSE